MKISTEESFITNTQPNKFLRVRQSTNIQQIQPQQILSAILNNQYLYLDFADEKQLKILQKDNPNDSEEEIQTIGNNYIAGLNNLSVNSYRMVQYLSENKKMNENKKNIDELIQSNIAKLKNSKKKSKGPQRKMIKNYSIGKNKEECEDTNQNKIETQIFKHPSRIQEYLERAHSNIILQKLKQGQRQLQKSLSSAGNFKKLAHSLDMKLKDKQTALKLPQIKKNRYTPRL